MALELELPYPHVNRVLKKNDNVRLSAGIHEILSWNPRNPQWKEIQNPEGLILESMKSESRLQHQDCRIPLMESGIWNQNRSGIEYPKP
jgi:hypothetical protein